MKFLAHNTPGGFNFSRLGPGDEELYYSLRSSISGGLSVVNNRDAKVGVTPIRGDDNYKCQSIVGYDFNALYLSKLAYQLAYQLA